MLHPYGYVDWSVRAGHGLTKEMGELIADAASALEAGPKEMTPKMGPWRPVSQKLHPVHLGQAKPLECSPRKRTRSSWMVYARTRSRAASGA